MKNQVKSINEIRQEQGLSPVDWGDKPIIPWSDANSAILNPQKAGKEAIEMALENLEYSKENWLLLSFRKKYFPPLPENSSRIMIRIPEELHLKLGKLANRRGLDFNSLVVNILEDEVST